MDGNAMTLSAASFPRVSLVVACLLLGVAATSAPAAAQAMSAEQACTPDVFRLCSGHIPDRARSAACLPAKRRARAPDCRRVSADPKPAKIGTGKQTE